MFIWALLWLITVVNTVSLFLYWRPCTIITITVISILCCTSLFTYTSIFRVARKRQGITARNTLGHHTSSGDRHAEVSRNMGAFLRELKMAKTYFLTVVLAFVCFLPGGIFVPIERFKSSWSETETEQISIGFIWILTLISMNSTLNCLIFFWANKMLRREAMKHFKNFLNKEK